jgi:outer membrane receptor protein involved in Fe transport
MPTWSVLSVVDPARVTSPLRMLSVPAGRRRGLVLIAAAFAIAPIAQTRAQPPAANPPPGAQQLDTINVEANRYRPLEPALPRYLGFLSLPQLPGVSLPKANFGFQVMDTMVVTATRAPQTQENVSASFRLLSSTALRQSPTLTLDGALRSVPGFSLFRRSDSLTANPTAQGVSLRGLGPSGASRSLVLLDGVPLNDPFGGWIAWTKLPREGMSHAEVVPGGGATAWGNAALGGVVHLFTQPARTQLAVVDQPPAPIAWSDNGSLRFAATLGDYGTRSAEVALVLPTRAGVLQVLGRDFATDGFRLAAPERRGPIDIAAWSRHRWLTVRWRQPIGQKLELLATGRIFEEKRNNGTPYQRNNSREKFASLAVAGQPADNLSWQAVAYVQDQTFASTFSGVNATRTAETPASDQFDVPSTAAGAAWTGIWREDGGARTSFGVDARFVRGETREHFTFTNGNFTRLRVAGGKQRVAGLFAVHDRPLSDEVRATVGARLDGWNESDGLRRETDRVTNAVFRNDRYADRDGTSFSPSLGLLWTPTKTWRGRANAQKAFRRPTLNELYRPFRVGANITEANAALGTERVTSAEVGVEWTAFTQRVKPSPTPPGNAPARGTGSTRAPQTQQLKLLTLGLAGFTNDLRDAVGNVTLARGPGTFPLFGTIAAGGVGRHRLNLERSRVRGLEVSARWMPADQVTVTLEYLRNDATVRRSSVAPALVGNRIAQVPRDTAALGAVWHAPGKIVVAPRLRWIGRQFEDDENQLRLGEVVIGDLSASRPLTKHLELFLTVENVGNARIETGRSVDGIVNVGTPRLAIGGLRGSW